MSVTVDVVVVLLRVVCVVTGSVTTGGRAGLSGESFDSDRSLARGVSESAFPARSDTAHAGQMIMLRSITLGCRALHPSPVSRKCGNA